MPGQLGPSLGGRGCKAQMGACSASLQGQAVVWAAAARHSLPSPLSQRLSDILCATWSGSRNGNSHTSPWALVTKVELAGGKREARLLCGGLSVASRLTRLPTAPGLGVVRWEGMVIGPWGGVGAPGCGQVGRPTAHTHWVIFSPGKDLWEVLQGRAGQTVAGVSAPQRESSRV